MQYISHDILFTLCLQYMRPSIGEEEARGQNVLFLISKAFNSTVMYKTPFAMSHVWYQYFTEANFHIYVPFHSVVFFIFKYAGFKYNDGHAGFKYMLARFLCFLVFFLFQSLPGYAVQAFQETCTVCGSTLWMCVINT